MNLDRRNPLGAETPIHMTNRTRYKSTIRLTARERSSLDRFIEWNSRLPKEAQLLVGDLSLTCGVLRRLLSTSKKEAHGKGTNRGP